MKFLITFPLDGQPLVGPRAADGYVEVYAETQDEGRVFARQHFGDKYGNLYFGLGDSVIGWQNLMAKHVPAGCLGTLDARGFYPAPNGMVACPDCGGSGDLDLHRTEEPVNPCQRCALGRGKIPNDQQ